VKLAEGDGITVNVNCWLAVFEALSVTVSVNWNVPAAVGEPVIAPAALSVSPAGIVPDQV
jgi:hypothetical protein